MSETLRALPFHPAEDRKKSFRNADGVAFKLQNIRYVATGKGLDSTSKIDRQVWEEFGLEPEAAKVATALILGAANTLQSLPGQADDSGDDLEFAEGKMVTALHKKRERHPGVRKALLKRRRTLGLLRCDICERTLVRDLPKLEDAMFEAHHTTPVATAGERKTRLADMALVCANCHRLLHRAISVNRRWLVIAEARSLFGADCYQVDGSH